MYIPFLLLCHSLLLQCWIEQSSVPRAHRLLPAQSGTQCARASEQRSGYSSLLPALQFILLNVLLLFSH